MCTEKVYRLWHKCILSGAFFYFFFWTHLVRNRPSSWGFTSKTFIWCFVQFLLWCPFVSGVQRSRKDTVQFQDHLVFGQKESTSITWNLDSWLVYGLPPTMYGGSCYPINNYWILLLNSTNLRSKVEYWCLIVPFFKRLSSLQYWYLAYLMDNHTNL